MCTADAPPIDVPAYSLYDATQREIDAYKWIRSEQAGRDLGEPAAREWVQMHWNGYLRERWMEHLEGVNYWIELDSKDFGLLKRIQDRYPCLPKVVGLLKRRGENLTILFGNDDPDVSSDELIEVLTILDINSKRIELRLVNCLVDHRSHHGRDD